MLFIVGASVALWALIGLLVIAIIAIVHQR